MKDRTRILFITCFFFKLHKFNKVLTAGFNTTYQYGKIITKLMYLI